MSLFSVKRRLVLGSMAALIGGGTFFATRTSKTPAKPDTETYLLSSIVDTILPADDFSGALELDLDLRLSERLESDEKLNKKYAELIPIIESLTSERHSKHFSELGIDQRESILLAILNDHSQAITAAKLSHIRTIIFKWYYQSDKGHNSLGYLLPSNYPSYASAKIY